MGPKQQPVSAAGGVEWGWGCRSSTNSPRVTSTVSRLGGVAKANQLQRVAAHPGVPGVPMQMLPHPAADLPAFCFTAGVSVCCR